MKMQLKNPEHKQLIGKLQAMENFHGETKDIETVIPKNNQPKQLKTPQHSQNKTQEIKCD